MQLLTRLTRFRPLIWAIFALVAVAGIRQVSADEATMRYAGMAPIDQYLMDRQAEIALARSAAPEAISRNATVLVLGRHGYETAVRGNNGFVCMVERGWVGALDWPEMWNPKIRGADCLNPPAARSILPLALLRTRMLLAGDTISDVFERMREALSSAELPPLGAGAMSYMMAKGSYLTDAGSHNGPHLMFFAPIGDPAVWGAGLSGSPVGFAPYWLRNVSANEEVSGLAPVTVFAVSVPQWSDGTAALSHMH